ncbi:hypothetical protein R0I52_08440 [Psychrobacter sp. CAM01]|uniref:TolB family protein n=1 Tax=Psychrobacter sp. CAM01 TaxID=3080335 RepID=UPI0029362E07|nr:hypothetical protein [Psychrobacter sp. CAM01]MDV2860736.1 hypothetical protein [Psychrobacter sp. CAM01]
MSKPTTNNIMIKGATTIAILAALTGCQTLPSTEIKKPNNIVVDSNPLTAAMPAIDRQGHIAYVEEQGVGSAKVSTLYSIRPDGSDLQRIDQINGYIYAPAWSADGQQLAYSKQAPNQHPNIYIHDRNRDTHNLVVNAQGSICLPRFHQMAIICYIAQRSLAMQIFIKSASVMATPAS